MKYYTTFLLIYILSLQISFGQVQKNIAKGTYLVDSTIKSLIEKKVNLVDEKMKGSILLKIYKNDSLIADLYPLRESFETQILSRLKGDTIYIAGIWGMLVHIGFQIVIFKDSCIYYYNEKSFDKSRNYKLKKGDLSKPEIFVPCTNYKLTLVNRPTFKKGEIIEGIIQLTSDDYYEVTDKGENKKKVQLTSYFKTNPLKTNIEIPK